MYNKKKKKKKKKTEKKSFARLTGKLISQARQRQHAFTSSQKICRHVAEQNWWKAYVNLFHWPMAGSKPRH